MKNMVAAAAIMVALGDNAVAAESPECIVDYSLMYAVAKNEHHPERDVGYPFLISFNKKSDAAAAKKGFSPLDGIEWLDWRTLDCKNKETCLSIFTALTESGVSNLDVGPYQVNYYWHKYEPEDLFDLTASYGIACGILMDINEKHGWGWPEIAKYHSATAHLNERYANGLKKTIMEHTR